MRGVAVGVVGVGTVTVDVEGTARGEADVAGPALWPPTGFLVTIGVLVLEKKIRDICSVEGNGICCDA